MSKFTDYFLKIPVRVYRTDLEDYDDLPDGEFGIAWARIHFEDLYNATWHEGYGKGVLLAGENKGFDLTIIRTGDQVYYCTWTMREFENALNKFMDKIDEMNPPPEQTEEDLEL